MFAVSDTGSDGGDDEGDVGCAIARCLNVSLILAARGLQLFWEALGRPL